MHRHDAHLPEQLQFVYNYRFQARRIEHPPLMMIATLQMWEIGLLAIVIFSKPTLLMGVALLTKVAAPSSKLHNERSEEKVCAFLEHTAQSLLLSDSLQIIPEYQSSLVFVGAHTIATHPWENAGKFNPKQRRIAANKFVSSPLT